MEPIGSPHAINLDTALLQLDFALKLWHFVNDEKLPHDEFDIDLTIDDRGTPYCMSGHEFHTYNDLVIATENAIWITFSAVVITLWEAIREKHDFSKGNPLQTDDERLAALIYMVRCCFAHGTALPRWKIDKEKYKIIYKVGNKNIDLRDVDGKPFDISTIGGLETMRILRDTARERKML